MPGRVFAFESGHGKPLALIPMAVRFSLDACCIKLSLKGWARLSLVQKKELLAVEVGTPAERENFVRLVSLFGNDEVTPMAMEAAVVEEAHGVPVKIVTHYHFHGLPPPTIQQWQALDSLQQYVLLKLSRSGKKHAAFLPAILEFGLQEAILTPS